MFTAVGRLGIASQNMLFYAKGGYASADVGVSGVSGDPVAGVTFSANERLDGWTIGAGLEWMVHRNLTLGLEYNYVKLNGAQYATASGGTVPGIPLVIDLDDVRVHTVMGRLTFKFDRERDAAPPLK